MEKSDSYYIRKKRMRELLVPSIGEIKNELGDDLADTLFKGCPDALQSYIGLTPFLNGPGNDLWISPSDILIGNVCLKPPLTSAHVRALTHWGILSIGTNIETKFRNKAELYKQKAIKEYRHRLILIAKLYRRKAIARVRKAERLKCENEKVLIYNEFKVILCEELDYLEEHLKEEHVKALNLQKLNLDEEWESKLAAAVSDTVGCLTRQCLQNVAEKERELLELYSIEMKRENVKREIEVMQAQDCCRKTLQQLRHELQCKNIANVMYVLCRERKKCELEIENLNKVCRKQINYLHDQLVTKDIIILKLIKERDEKINQLNLRDKCLREILKQFQKFINFALRASPTQAEFLLSIEKIMLYELTKAAAEKDNKQSRRIARKYLPWKTESKKKLDTVQPASLLAADHHRCYHEIDFPQDDSRSLTSFDYLPAFHYNKDMYVREDFRNMMSQGIEVTTSNEIWNRDVEDLILKFKRSVTTFEQSKEEDEEEEEEKSKSYEWKDRRDIRIKDDVQMKEIPVEPSEGFTPGMDQLSISRKSVVYFKDEEGEGNLLFPEFLPIISNLGEFASEINETIVSSEVEKSEFASVPLIGARNSLELTREKSVMHHLEEGMGILGVRDSLQKHRLSIKPTDTNQDILQNIYKPPSLNEFLEETTSEIPSEFRSNRRPSRIEDQTRRVSLKPTTLEIINSKTDGVNAVSGLKKGITIQKSNKRDGTENVTLKKTFSSDDSKIVHSKLGMSRDSLELIRSQSKLFCPKHLKGSDNSKESVEIKHGIISLHTDDERSLSKTKPNDDSSKMVRMSYVEIIGSDKVGTADETEYVSSNNVSTDSPWIIYSEDNVVEKDNVMRENFLTKPNVASVEGDKTGKEHMETTEEFTVHRAESLMSIFKKHPSLMRIFTSCTK